MSCFILESKSLAILAEGIEKTLNMGYNYMGMDAPEALREALADCADNRGFYERKKIFLRLYELNAQAYDSRYSTAPADYIPECPDIPTVIKRAEYKNYHHTVTTTHYKYANLLDCYLYQCLEGKTPEEPLFQGLEAFKRTWYSYIVRNSDEYAAASWGEF